MFRFYMIIFILTLTSCSYTKYTCQTIETESSNVQKVNNEYRYEDSLVIINYNLWSSGGKMSFTIYNKTDVPIYINWKYSNFIYAGYNNEYWSDQIVANRNINAIGRSTTAGQSATRTGIELDPAVTVTSRNYKSYSTLSVVASNETTYFSRENPSVQIPPRSYNFVQRFNLNFPFFDLGSKTLNFDRENTPLHFRNYLAISRDKNFNDQIFIDNEFWVSALKSQTDWERKPTCAKNINPSVSSFYIYNRDIISLKERKDSREPVELTVSQRTGKTIILLFFGLVGAAAIIALLF